MTNDIVALIEYYEKEKGIDREKIIAALEFSFVSAYRKMVPGADAIEELRADVDTKKGNTRIFASLTVVADDDHQDKFNEVPVSLAQKKDATAEIGGTLEFNVTPKDFGRIAVQTAKQTMMQRLRQAEKEMIYEEFKDRAGDVVSGTVRRFERNDGNGLMLSGYHRGAKVTSSHFAFTGATAVAAWGRTDELTDNGVHGYDATPGDIPVGTLVQGNIMRESGIWEKQSSCFFSAKAPQSTLLDNICFNLPRAVFNFNDGMGGGDQVHNNLIFNSCR